MRLVATIGWYWSCALKSRTTAQSRSTGASMIVLRTTFGISASEGTFERIKAALEHASADIGNQFAFLVGRAIEIGRPLDEGPVMIGDRGEPQGRHVVAEWHGRVEDRIGAEHVEVREAEQLLAQPVAVSKREIADAAHLVRGFA